MMWFAVKDIVFTIAGAFLAPRIYRSLQRSVYFAQRKNHAA
jgi:biotin transport system substrate-specific component